MSSWYQSLASRGRPTAAHVWQPRNTSSVIFSKGLLNAPGENNCFLNSAVQVLWHLDVFRRSFWEMGGHACMGKACIFCALKVLFTQLRYSEQQSLPPDALRKALAVAFQDEHRFQLGCMDDAAECFENILTRIHFHLAHDIKEELCDAKHCIPHRKFAMTLIEHSVCTCGATSEPFPFTQMVHYVSCTALCAEAKKLKEKYRWSNSVCFGQVLRNAGAIGDIRDCPSECGKKINIRRVLMNCPDVVAIGLVWDSDCPEKEHIVDVIQCLGTSLRMPDLFNSVVDEKAKQAALHLVGVVTYYGKHYSTFFYNTALRVWVYFDDATVKQVGPNWRDVVNRCKRGHSQPLLLLFANPDGSPVPTDTAPQESTLLPGYTQTKNPTAIKPSRIRGMVDDTSTSSIKCQSLQPVWEYEPDLESQHKSFPEQKDDKKNRGKYVVEIGHDALRSIQARHNSGHSTSQNSQSLKQRDTGILDNVRQPGKTVVPASQKYSNKNAVEVKHRVLPLPANQLAMKNAAQSTDASPHNNSSTAPCRTKENEYGGQIHNLSEDTENYPLHSHSNDETHGNMSLLNSRGLPMSDFGASHPVGTRVTGINYSSGLHYPNTNPGQMSHPRRLERHESWSGRPSQPLAYAPKTSQSRQYMDNKYSVQRHNSFSHRPMPNSQPHTIFSSVLELQDKPLGLGCKMPRHAMHKSQSMLEYSSNQQSMPQFGSVPNLHRGFDLISGKSISVQNIAMAEEGILANAIKNNIQQKRASTSDVSTYMGSSNGSCNSQLVTSGVIYGQEQVLGSTSQHSPTMADITTQSKKQNMDDIQPSRHLHSDRCFQKDAERALLDKPEVKPEGLETLGKSNDELNHTHHANQMHNTYIDHNPFRHKRTTRDISPQVLNSSPTIGCYGLRDRDSVASRDSGYRSRDRSSASSGSVYSIEASANGGPQHVGTREQLNEQNQTTYEHQANQNHKPATCVNRAQDTGAVFHKVCAECADLEAQSRRMGDAGDLATALALCTASVTKLKECLKLDGISSQTRQLLHSKYNNAVLQSRNLHRRLTLLRRQDSFPLSHDQLSHDIQHQSFISPNQPNQPAKELNLIDLKGNTVETSRVDRLKQQLHELYMQKPSPKLTNIQCVQPEASRIPQMPPSQPLTRPYSAKAHVPANSKQCMVNGFYPDAHIHLSHRTAEKEPVTKYTCQTVGRNEDVESSDIIQHDIHVDLMGNTITDTRTQQKYGEVMNHSNQHFIAHMFNYCTIPDRSTVPNTVTTCTVADSGTSVSTDHHSHCQQGTSSNASARVFPTQTRKAGVYHVHSAAVASKAVCKD